MSSKYFYGLLIGYLLGRTYTWIVFRFVMDYSNVLEPIWTHVLGSFALIVIGFMIGKVFLDE